MNVDPSALIEGDLRPFWRLYRYDVIDLFSRFNWNLFAPFFMHGDGELDVVMNTLQPTPNSPPIDARRRQRIQLAVWDRIAHNTKAWDVMEKELARVDMNLYNEMHVEKRLNTLQQATSFAKFKELMMPPHDPKKLDRIAAIIEVDWLRDAAPLRPPLTFGLDDRRRSLDRHKKFGPIFAKDGLVDRLLAVKDHLRTRRAGCAFLREIALQLDQEDYYLDLLEAMRGDPYNRVVARVIDPNYEQTLEDRYVRRIAMDRKRNESTKRPKEVEVKPDHLQECRRQTADRDGKIMEVLPVINWEAPPADELKLRGYQAELVEFARLGLNSVIVAPTGSGKTVVAVDVALRHLESRRETGQPARVVLIVPKIPLVEQQAGQMMRYMRRQFAVDGIWGEMPTEGRTRLSIFLAADLIVATPQIMVNMLRSVRADDRILVPDMTLVILDECHHTTKNNPYNTLMHIINDFKGTKPQVVGLTASLGVGSGTNEESALAHVYRLCANMGVHRISTVRKPENVRELQVHVNPPMDEIITARRDQGEFVSHIESRMLKILGHLKTDFKWMVEEKCRDHQGNILREGDVVLPIRRMFADAFLSMLIRIRKCVEKLYEGDRKYRILRALKHLEIYHNALAMASLLPSIEAWVQLHEEMEKAKNSQITTDTEYLRDLWERGREELKQYAVREEDKEIVDKLLEVLEMQYRVNPAARVLVFVERKFTAKALARVINKKLSDRGLMKIDFGYLMSARKGGDASQSPEEQESVLRGFREGRLRGLVTTSIAEEGLDVQACNLIVKYNSTQGVITLVQRRGRARQMNSRSVLIVIDSAVEEREIANIRAEKLMAVVVHKIQNMPDQVFEDKVKQEAENERRDREAAELARQRTKDRLRKRHWIVTCKECNKHLCESDELRMVNGQLTVANVEIWSRINVTHTSSVKSVDDVFLLVGKAMCQCGRDLGNVISFAGVFLPILKAVNIMFSSLGVEPQTYGKLKSILENVVDPDEISEDEMKTMLKMDTTKATEFEVEQEKLYKKAKNRKPYRAALATNEEREDDIDRY